MLMLSQGRSPFEPPLRDDDGNLILGPHTHDDDAQGYVQQFDGRGHPTSRHSDVQNRKLRRAQNEVYKLAGVVRSNHDEPKDDDHWKSMRSNELKALVKDENDFFKFCIVPFDKLILDFATAWNHAFRNRLMTYRSYLQIPFVSMLQSETRILGLRETVFSGTPLSLLVGVSRRRRVGLYSWDYHRVSLMSPRSKSRRSSADLLSGTSARLLELLWFGLEWPYSICASLQTLHLIPSTLLVSPRNILDVLSIFLVDGIPIFPETLTTKDLAIFAFSWLKHPFTLSYVFDQVRESIQSGIQAIIRSYLPVPDEPDEISDLSGSDLYLAADEYLTARILGYGWDVGAKRRYYGPRSFSERLRMAFPGASSFMYALTGFPANTKAHLTPENEVAIKKICELRYGHLWRENRHFTEAQRVSDSIIRRRAVQEALARVGIDPVEEGISVDDWSREVIPERFLSGGSTATPDPEDLFTVAEGSEVPFELPDTVDRNEDQASDLPALPEPTDPGNVAADTTIAADAGDSGQTQAPEMRQSDSFEPMVPLQTLLEPLQAGSTVLDAMPPAPEPGITRAMSLEQAPLRPVRRPTELGEQMMRQHAAFASRPFETFSPPVEAFEEPEDPVHHRVTLLSNLPAEIFAYQAGTLITSILFLPWDMYYNRMLARTFLSSPRLRDPAGSRLLDDVWPSNSWKAESALSSGRNTRFISNMALGFALQAVVSSLFWHDVKTATLMGGRYYGWGKV